MTLQRAATMQAWTRDLAPEERQSTVLSVYFTSSYDYNCFQSPVSRFVVVHEGKKQEKMAERQHKWHSNNLGSLSKSEQFSEVLLI